MDKPRVGRIVHWKNSTGVIYSAIITHVWSDDLVNIGVFSSTYAEMTSVLRGDGQHQWQWPVKP